jgi:phosphoribosylaminoimidazole (AIR) synthetase
MLKTFNMGWGFAVVIDKKDADEIITNFEKCGVEAEQIGEVNNSEKIVAHYKKRKLELN